MKYSENLRRLTLQQLSLDLLLYRAQLLRAEIRACQPLEHDSWPLIRLNDLGSDAEDCRTRRLTFEKSLLLYTIN